MTAKLLIPFLRAQCPLMQNLAFNKTRLRVGWVGFGRKLDNGTAKKLKLGTRDKVNKPKKLAETALVLMNLTPTPGWIPSSDIPFANPARMKPVTFPGLKIPVKIDP